jgi:hypothetical protein
MEKELVGDVLTENTPFEVFDRQSEKNYRTQTAILSIDSESRRMRLNVPAMELLKILDGGRVKFLRFNKCWFIVITTQETGFGVSLSNGQRSGGTINNATTAGIILRELAKNAPKADFYLHAREHELHGHPVYELLKKPE